MLRALFGEKTKPVKDVTYFVNLFLKYQHDRAQEAWQAKTPLEKHYSSRLSIYGRIHKLTGKPKCDAAIKMIGLLLGEDKTLTHKEWFALRANDLGKITKECEDEKLLPEKFIAQEKVFLSKGELHYTPEIKELRLT